MLADTRALRAHAPTMLRQKEPPVWWLSAETQHRLERIVEIVSEFSWHKGLVALHIELQNGFHLSTKQ